MLILDYVMLSKGYKYHVGLLSCLKFGPLGLNPSLPPFPHLQDIEEIVKIIHYV